MFVSPGYEWLLPLLLLASIFSVSVLNFLLKLPGSLFLLLLVLSLYLFLFLSLSSSLCNMLMLWAMCR